MENLLAVCELLSITPVFTCKSPYGGYEAWWNEVEPGRCCNYICVCGDGLVYTRTRGLPGTWFDQGDYLFLDI